MITVDDIIKVLNEAAEADEPAIRALIDHRVAANEALAAHDTIEVGVDRIFGVLGLINGITRLEGGIKGGTIRCVQGDDGKILRFERHCWSQ